MSLNAGFIQLSGNNVSWSGSQGYTIGQILPSNLNRSRALITSYLSFACIGGSGVHVSGLLYGSGNYRQLQTGEAIEVRDTDSIWGLGISGTIYAYAEEIVGSISPIPVSIVSGQVSILSGNIGVSGIVTIASGESHFLGSPVVRFSGFSISGISTAVRILPANSGRIKVTLTLGGAGGYVASNSGVAASGGSVPIGSNPITLEWQTEIWVIPASANTNSVQYQEESLW